MAPVIADDAFRLARSSGGVENVERIGGCYGHTPDHRALRLLHLCRQPEIDIPVLIPEWRVQFVALQDEAEIRLHLGHVHRMVEQRLVGDEPPRFQPAACADHHLGSAVIDARRQFVRRKPSEDDGVDGAEPCAGKHGEHGFRHHRHVDDDPVAFPDAVIAKHGGNRLHLVQHLLIAVYPLFAVHRAVVDQRRLVASALLDMPVQAVVAGIGLATGEPASIDALVLVEDGIDRREPMKFLRLPPPEFLRRRLPITIHTEICALHLLLP